VSSGAACVGGALGLGGRDWRFASLGRPETKETDQHTAAHTTQRQGSQSTQKARERSAQENSKHGAHMAAIAWRVRDFMRSKESKRANGETSKTWQRFGLSERRKDVHTSREEERREREAATSFDTQSRDGGKKVQPERDEKRARQQQKTDARMHMCLSQHLGLVRRNHIFEIDERVFSSVHFEQFERFVDQVADVATLLLRIIDLVADVHCTFKSSRTTRHIQKQE
jgi:hypothetical protein